MAEVFKGKEKREYFRYNHAKPVRYKIIDLSQDKASSVEFMDAISKNLSASGVLFTSNYLPEISSIVMIDLDTRTSNVCKEIESHAMIVGDKMVGKIVRIEESGEGQYDVGVAFVKKSDALAKEIKTLLKSA